MHIEFDAAKSERNARERRLPFSLVAQLDFGSARIWQDTRKPYPEARFNALGCVGSRLHFVCFTPVAGGIRIISFRKANARERIQYEQA